MPRITIAEPGKTPQPYRLKTDRKLTKIGRGSDNDIQLSTGSASTYHCEMKRVSGGFTLEDNNSTNGIKLEETRYNVIDLEDGQTVFIGDDIEFKFELSEEEAEILEEEDFEPQQRAAFPKAKEDKPKKKASKAVESIDLDDDDEEEYEEVVIRRKKKKKPVAIDEDEDDDEELEEAKPKAAKAKPKAKPRLKADSSDSPRPAAAPIAKSGGGIGATVLFALLAVLFLLGGMVARHAIEEKTFLFSKKTEVKDKPAPAEQTPAKE